MRCAWYYKCANQLNSEGKIALNSPCIFSQEARKERQLFESNQKKKKEKEKHPCYHVDPSQPLNLSSPLNCLLQVLAQRITYFLPYSSFPTSKSGKNLVSTITWIWFLLDYIIPNSQLLTLLQNSMDFHISFENHYRRIRNHCPAGKLWDFII